MEIILKNDQLDWAKTIASKRAKKMNTIISVVVSPFGVSIKELKKTLPGERNIYIFDNHGNEIVPTF